MNYCFEGFSHLNTTQLAQINALLAGVENPPYYEENAPAGERCFYIASDCTSKRAVGFLSFLHVPEYHEAEIFAYVAPQCRRQNIFTELFTLACQELKRLKVTFTYAQTSGQNCSHSEYLLQLDANVFREHSYVPVKGTFLADNSILYDSKTKKSLSWCYLHPQKDCLFIYGVRTATDSLRKGYAYSLMCDVLTEHFANNNTPVRLQVSSRNKAALALYKKLSFKEAEHIDYIQIAMPKFIPSANAAGEVPQAAAYPQNRAASAPRREQSQRHSTD